MLVVHQADDPFVCFGAKPNKGLSLRSSTRQEVGKGTLEKGVEKRNSEKAVGRGAVDTGQQKKPVGVR